MAHPSGTTTAVAERGNCSFRRAKQLWLGPVGAYREVVGCRVFHCKTPGTADQCTLSNVAAPIAVSYTSNLNTTSLGEGFRWCVFRSVHGRGVASDTRGTCKYMKTPPEVLCTLYILKRGKLHQQATTTTNGFRVSSHRVDTAISPRRGELERERAAPVFRHSSATVYTHNTYPYSSSSTQQYHCI